MPTAKSYRPLLDTPINANREIGETMAQSIVKKESFKNGCNADQVLGLAGSLCTNLPQAIGASSGSTDACVAAKMGEIGVIQERMRAATPEEMPSLISQNEAAYRALNRKDIQNKFFGLAITITVCESVARIIKYACKAAGSIA